VEQRFPPVPRDELSEDGDDRPSGATPVDRVEVLELLWQERTVRRDYGIEPVVSPTMPSQRRLTAIARAFGDDEPPVRLNSSSLGTSAC
jgi:hypothetical protein